MKRIMHCIASLEVGGVEKRVLDSLDHLAQRGCRHQHTLVAFRGGAMESDRTERLRMAGMDCLNLHRHSRFDLRFAAALRKAVQDTQPDIIHAYNQTAALWVRRCKGRRLPQRVLVHCGGVGAFDRLWRHLERRMLGRTDAFVFNSESTRQVWTHFLNIRCPQHVVYNGVSCDASSLVNEPPQLADSPFVLLTVCRIVPVKSIITQVRAVKCLHESGRRDVRLMIVGDGTDRGRIEAEATRLGVEESVSFEGHQPCPRSFHRRAHVFLSTSYNETFGMTLAEAMSDGMICIAASAGGPSELIDHGNSGFLVPCTESVPRELRGRMPKGQALPTVVYDASLGGLRPVAGVDPAVLANQIAQVRARYNELSTMRLAAQERIRRHFSLEHYCQSLEGVYDGLT